MKKLSILLLALVLAGGMVFAADIEVSGDVVFSTSFDLDNGTGGLDGVDATDIDGDYSIDITLGTGEGASKTGEGDLYVNLVTSVDDLVITWTDSADGSDDLAWAGNGPDISVDTFEIVAPDFTIDLLGGSTGNYASYWALDEDGDDTSGIANYSVGTAATGGLSGVDLILDVATVGFDFIKTATATGWGVWASTTQDLAEGVSVSIAGGIDDTNKADLSAQIAYAGDISATIGVDTVDNFANYEMLADIAASLSGLDVTALVWVDDSATPLRVNADASTSVSDFDVSLAFGWDEVSYDADNTVYLAADSYVSATVGTVIDALTLEVSGGWDFDDSAAEASVDASYSLSDETSIAANVAYTGANTNVITVGGSVTQVLGAGSLVGEVTYNDSADDDNKLDAAVTWTSTDLINGATAEIGWATDDLTGGVFGTITASLTVSL